MGISVAWGSNFFAPKQGFGKLGRPLLLAGEDVGGLGEALLLADGADGLKGKSDDGIDLL